MNANMKKPITFDTLCECAQILREMYPTMGVHRGGHHIAVFPRGINSGSISRLAFFADDRRKVTHEDVDLAAGTIAQIDRLGIIESRT